MTYYHCPKTFYRKPYGCGFGPVNATQAFFDHQGRCPECGQELKRDWKIRGPERRMELIEAHLEAAATAAELFGPTAGDRYLRTHKPRR